ncbi:MAG: gyrase subunit A protein [Parcubacteria group bacterium GW2011_GWA2_43_11]|nr:MAG: gyrase subunit A protein [Parcubacteria group bacterium GW2011_GWC2_42_11]KKS85725.1 MAG: gyrase subunit A protein [Parcubacteria group bacterium GW2011_GWA2_43_11]
MAKEDKKKSPSIENGEGKQDASVIACPITGEMRESYLAYAMSVITQRALPDVRDGLKPVHRRILYTMHKMGLVSSAKFRKSAAVVGDVLGKYHPHGDTAVYDALVKLAQEFTTRYPLVLGQGNFGSIDGDSPAAMRYTEAKMTKISSEMLRDIEKETVEWRPNYDETRDEPIVLPAAVPNLLLNGTLGIAVGMATNIPPHNLNEVVDACIHLINNPDASQDEIFNLVKAPDFPTGAVIFNQKDIRHAYATGKGPMVVRGEAEIVENKKGAFSIIITSLPYRVNKSELIKRMANLVTQKKLEGVRDLRDESTRDIRIVVELKTGAQPQKVLNYLYKHTALEDTFHLNLVALVDGVPQTLSLKGVLDEFVTYRKLVVKRRCEFDLKKAQAREHILLGLKKALDNIDAIIKIIKTSKDVPLAKAAMMKKFSFSDIQATAILEMRLQKLAGLERIKIENELKEVQALIKWLESLLKSEKKMAELIRGEFEEVKAKYGDERRTRVIKGPVKNMTPEDMIAEEESVLVITRGGYIKRTNPDEYKKQKRGGVGVIDLNTKEEDFVTIFLTASTHDDLLFFTDKGKTYQIKMYDVPEGKRATKGKSVMNFLPLSADESVTSVVAMTKELKESDGSLLMVTKGGITKKTKAKDFHDVRLSGIIAIKLAPGDKLIQASFVEKGDTVLLATKKGQSIRFNEADAREMGRAAAGVRGVKLGTGDVVIGADIALKGTKDKELSLLVVSENGYGKQTALSEFKVQKRSGSGIKCASTTTKTGTLMASRILTRDIEELVVISKKGQVIRTDIKEIPSMGRSTQGVRIMKLRAGDSIAAIICL